MKENNLGINDQNINKYENWARSPIKEPYLDLSPENRKLIQDF